VLYSERIEHIEEAFYHYYQENQSTVRNRNNPHQYEKIRLTEYILDYGKKHPELKIYKDIIEYKYLNMQGANLIYTCMGQFDKPDKKMMKKINSGINENIPDLLKNDNYKKLSNEFKAFLRLNRVSSSICIFCYKHNIYTWTEIILNKIGRKKQ
jgi:hypothetical protein